MKNISLGAFPVESYLGLLEVAVARFVEDGDCEPVANKKSIVNVLVGRVQMLHPTHADSERNHLSLLRTSIHHLEFS